MSDMFHIGTITRDNTHPSKAQMIILQEVLALPIPNGMNWNVTSQIEAGGSHLQAAQFHSQRGFHKGRNKDDGITTHALSRHKILGIDPQTPLVPFCGY